MINEITYESTGFTYTEVYLEIIPAPILKKFLKLNITGNIKRSYRQHRTRRLSI